MITTAGSCMAKPRIRELIVVEGRNDTANLRRYFECDTIETGGTHLSRQTLDMIARAAEVRGVIVFTDPDAPGNRIRHAVNEAVPGCRNAHVDRNRAKTSRKVGVEHAGYEALQEALSSLVTYDENRTERITASDMYELGLSGRSDSGARRMALGRKLHLGYGNARTMRDRLNDLGITKEELMEAMKE